jgi:hypothetical protein
MLASAPASPSYLQYVAPTNDAENTEGEVLASPLWAVGFTGFENSFPGGLLNIGPSAGTELITGRIVFVDDDTDTTVLALDCPS